MQKQCWVFGILRYILASQSMVIMPMRCDFNGTKASADSEEISVSVGSRHLHRSPGQEDTKVVRQGQMDSYYERFCERVAMGLPGRVIDLDVAGLEHEADDEKEEGARYGTEVESEVNGYEETAFGVLLPILSEAVLSVTGPSDQELNSVPQASGNVPPEIAKQSLPHAKKLKRTVKTSIGSRLNEFLSLDNDREDIEVTFIGYVPITLHTHLPAQGTLAGSIPLSADEVLYSPTVLMQCQRSYRKETTRGLG